MDIQRSDKIRRRMDGRGTVTSIAPVTARAAVTASAPVINGTVEPVCEPMMKSPFWIVCFATVMFASICSNGQRSLRAEEPVFSGPQVGEKLSEFDVDWFGDRTGNNVSEEDKTPTKPRDRTVQLGDGPSVIIFVHELTRPGFGLARTLGNFCATRRDRRLQTIIVFLTEDSTKTLAWMSSVKKHFVDGVAYCVSTDGIEGPGSYGLNRKVTMTVLIGDDGRVSDNFALVQPSIQADGPGILAAIAGVTGGGEVPSVAEIDPRNRSREPMRPNQRANQRPNRQQGTAASGKGDSNVPAVDRMKEAE